VNTTGILHPVAGLRAFDLHRERSPADLAPFVEWIWSVRWALPAGAEYEQATLPFPCTHLVWEEGRYRVHGPRTKRFIARLAGTDSVLGIRFRPAGFSAFSTAPMRRLVDRVMSVEEALGVEPPPAASSVEAARDHMVGLLRARRPRASAALALANRVVAAAEQDPALTRAAQLARIAGCSVRSLHRLLERHVGVGTKWIVRRARVQAAAERVARGEAVDWAGLAVELGYADQAHLIRDFRDQVGETPAAYAARCAAAARA